MQDTVSLSLHIPTSIRIRRCFQTHHHEIAPHPPDVQRHTHPQSTPPPSGLSFPFHDGRHTET